MIEITDIYRSINKLLIKNFENIPVQIKDLKVPNPPCFYIKFITETTSQTAQDYQQNNCSFDVIYFASDENLLELLEIKEKLEHIFKKPLQIELTNNSETIIQYQEINNIDVSLNEEDYVLNCTISMAIEQRLEDEKEIFEIKDKNGNIISTGSKNRFGEYENEETMDEIEYII